MIPFHELILDRLFKFRFFPWRGALLVLAISFVLSSMASTFFDYFLLPSSKIISEGSAGRDLVIENEMTSLNKEQITTILNRNLFNKQGTFPEEGEKKKDEVKDEVIKSTLPIKLVGTIYGGDPFSGLAVIEDASTHNQNSFVCGDNVLRGSILLEVHKKKIILQVENHKEYVEIEEKELLRTQRVTKKAADKSSAGEDAEAKIVGDAFTEEGFERHGTGVVMSNEYRNKLLKTDFAKVLQDAKADPYYEGGELSGFKLTKVRGASIYEKSGLQNEDIVKEINGVSLVDTAQTIKLLNSLRGESDIEIRLVRGGKPITINMQVR
ncbi:MAG: hypothetical protein KA436_05910 [Oligoflexales bacterium]|nr:hypothetical protein [Oligoflexales bacterium]